MRLDLPHSVLRTTGLRCLPLHALRGAVRGLPFSQSVPQLPPTLPLLRDQLRLPAHLPLDALQHQWGLHPVLCPLCHLPRCQPMPHLFDRTIQQRQLYQQLSPGYLRQLNYQYLRPLRSPMLELPGQCLFLLLLHPALHSAGIHLLGCLPLGPLLLDQPGLPELPFPMSLLSQRHELPLLPSQLPLQRWLCVGVSGRLLR